LGPKWPYCRISSTLVAACERDFFFTADVIFVYWKERSFQKGEGKFMASFEELKQKYKSVLDVVQQQNVQMKNLHFEGNKLVMKGAAPSLDAANRVWDEIKRVNPKADDITADFPVDANLAKSAAGTKQEMYTVKAGDTLSKISKQFYGDSNKYMHIFEANKDKLKDPDKIQPGQQLKIPAA
jgi:nucleoid-associated protein YgaU